MALVNTPFCRVLIIEDQGMFFSLLKDWLGPRLLKRFQSGDGAPRCGSETKPEFIWALNCRTARRIIASELFDIALLDFHLPDGDGIELANEIKLQAPKLRSIGISGLNDEWTVWRIVDSALHGFVTKSKTGLQELESVFMGVLNGNTSYSSDFKRLRVEYTRDSRSIGHVLSGRELDVLRQVVQGYDDSEVGQKLGISRATARKHRQHLLEKFAVASSPKLMASAWKLGFDPRIGLPQSERCLCDEPRGGIAVSDCARQYATSRDNASARESRRHYCRDYFDCPFARAGRCGVR